MYHKQYIYKTNYQNTYVITFTSVKGQIYITYALRYYVPCISTVENIVISIH